MVKTPKYIDFNRMSLGSLRRFQARFKLPDDLKTREELVKACSEHFVEMNVDFNKVISKFLKIKKDERQDDSHYLRKSARNWNKEKQSRKEAQRREKYDLYKAQKIVI